MFVMDHLIRLVFVNAIDENGLMMLDVLQCSWQILVQIRDETSLPHLFDRKTLAASKKIEETPQRQWSVQVWCCGKCTMYP